MYPVVSIILPVYNGGRHVGEAVRSILSQSFKCFELIVIDDGSQDNTLDILREYAKSDVRVRVFSRENRGLVSTLNEGLAISCGRYIARMDADDISFPNRLSHQVEYLDKNPDVVLLGVSVTKSLKFKWKMPELTGKKESTWGLVFRNNVGHPGVMMRGKVIRDNNLYYREDYRYAEDFKLWNEMVRFGNADILPQQLLYYRVHSDSVSVVHKKAQALIDRKIVLENVLERFDIDMSDYFHLDIRSWVNKVTDFVFSSAVYASLPVDEKVAIIKTYQEYCSGFGINTFSHFVSTVGVKGVVSSGARMPISIYRMTKRELWKEWRIMEI